MKNYTLIITEKPSAAQRIASALNTRGRIAAKEDRGVPYYIATRDRDVVVVPALGHLYNIVEERKGRDYYPVFNFKWVPKHSTKKEAKRIRNWIAAISNLAKNADTFINACDYDVEGSVIGYYILKYACGSKEKISKRMRYSTLTQAELEKSYTEPLPHLDFALIEAGIARHEVDWLFGVNLSRALTITARNCSGRYATLSTGRVQGPSLKFIVNREKTIMNFVPTPFWEIRAEIKIDKYTFEAEYEKPKIRTEAEAYAIQRSCQGADAKVEKIDVKQYHVSPPVPYDLGSLQQDAYKYFKYTPRHTSNVAQRLYLEALISYPRTNSQRLPREIGYKTILRNLSRDPEYCELAQAILSSPVVRPREGKKSDPAHPAIYPTGKAADRDLDPMEARILDLIIRRFMSTFEEPAEKQSVKISINANGHNFYLRGRRTLKEGWQSCYEPFPKQHEAIIPAISEKQCARMRKIIVERRFTKPPTRYNPGSLLAKMEQTGIGTKATRAEIIQTLYNRRYIQNERIRATDLGFQVLETLEKHCPKAVSVKFTSEIEERMNKIQAREEKKEKILLDAVETLKSATEILKEEDETIGARLTSSMAKARLEKRIVGSCPTCGTGKLMILRSKKTGKRFLGCTNYFEAKCSTSFPLPQKGSIVSLNRTCRTCGWPKVQIHVKRRRSWTLCFNPDCTLNREKRHEMPAM